MVPDEVAGSFERAGSDAVLLDAALVHAGRALADAQAALDPVASGEAIRTIVESVPLIPEGHPRRPMAMTMLGTAHRTRYDATGDPRDLEAALSVGEDAADALARDDPAIGYPLQLVAMTLLRRFERFGSSRAKASAASSPTESAASRSRGSPVAS